MIYKQKISEISNKNTIWKTFLIKIRFKKIKFQQCIEKLEGHRSQLYFGLFTSSIIIHYYDETTKQLYNSLQVTYICDKSIYLRT